MAPSATTLLVGLCILSLTILASTSYDDYPLLDPYFYQESCPNFYNIVKEHVKLAVEKEKRMGASLLRLFFHDCFVQGCDASVLLDDTRTFVGEKKALPNINSIRGFEVIDEIKAAIENACPGIVSCADILAISSRDSVVELGGPYWEVKLGRRDSLTASQILANLSIPLSTRNLNELISSFDQHGLCLQDLVALSGAHTIGVARCTTFRDHIYNDLDVDFHFATMKKARCPITLGHGDDNNEPLDLKTATVFDNYYYKNLVEGMGLLHSDQELYKYGNTAADFLVRLYSNDMKSFFEDFAAAMIKMGDIKPIVGREGEIRRNCRYVN